MSPKNTADPEEESQTPEEVEDVPQDDAVGLENQEQNGEHEGADGISMTMEERKAKMQQLRAKMVCHITLTSNATVHSTTTCSGRLHSRTGPL
jgi:hypothetical protein